MIPSTPDRPLILGTAGHIDHGKTALVRALTGIEADRLPEEKKRGMTIDLGFAHLELGGRQIGVVDVPGHERFIRNMVAGATGIDLVMLVVAADDGVMPQTREHLEIVDLLGIAGGVVALTKIDLADENKILAAEASITALVRGTRLEDAPMVRVSSVTGAGIDLLREKLAACIGALEFASWPPLFRLPIDRRFTLQGHGTVVTGSLMGGDAAASDEVELLPMGRRLRVRSVQSHGERRRGLDSGRRIALNLPGIKTRQIRRGDELAAPGYLRPSARLAVRLECLPSSPLEIAARQWFRLHVGAQSTDARFTLIGRGDLEPSQNRLALLQSAEPILAAHGQRFIVRSASHGVTIGGGTVLCTNPPKIKLSEETPAWLEAIESGSPMERILALLEIEPELGGGLRGLYRESGVEPDDAERILQELAEAGRIIRAPGLKGSKNPGFWTQDYIERRKTRLLERMRDLLEKSHPRAALDHGALMHATSAIGTPEFVSWLLNQLEQEGKAFGADGRFGLAGYKVELKETDREQLGRLLEVFESGGFAPPPPRTAMEKTKLPKAKAESLYAHAVDTGRIIELRGDLALHRSTHDELIRILRENMDGGRGLPVSRIKDLLGVSRKWAIPICEYLDRAGYTRRQGDLRYAGPKMT